LDKCVFFSFIIRWPRLNDFPRYSAKAIAFSTILLVHVPSDVTNGDAFYLFYFLARLPQGLCEFCYCKYEKSCMDVVMFVVT
jgi:hypothetical protein